MAAIIAQLTRAQRERNNRVTYETNKCLYQLPPFDQHFDPLVHNKYLSRKAKLLERQAKMEERSFNFEQHLKRRKRTTNNFGKFTYKKCLLETLIIASLLCLVPGALLAVELLWTEEELSALENS